MMIATMVIRIPTGYHRFFIATDLCEQEMIVNQEKNRMKMQHKVKETKRTLRMLRTEKMMAKRRAPLLTHISKFSATPVNFR